MNILYVVGIVLMVLKLCAVITLGWGWIAAIGLAPIWVPLVMLAVIFIIAAFASSRQ